MKRVSVGKFLSFLMILLLSLSIPMTSVSADEVPPSEEYQKIVDRINNEYDLRFKITLPDTVQDYTLEEFEKMIMDEVLPYLLELEGKGRVGEEPDHNPSIVKFDENVNIDIFFNLDNISFEKHLPYSVKVRNHDEVMIPCEELFEQLKLDYSWNKAEKKILIKTDAEYEFELDKSEYIKNGKPYPSDATLFTVKEDCLYVIQSILDIIETNRYYALVYHDLHKVVFVTMDKFTSPYSLKMVQMIEQFARVDCPLSESPGVLVDKKSLIFSENAPYVVNVDSKDYIMLPLRETLEQLGYTVTWDAVSNSAVINTDKGDYIVKEKYALIFNDKAIETALKPVIINGRFFVPHDLIGHILEMNNFISYTDNEVFFRKLENS